MDVILLGAPGAGKGTQAEILRERCGYVAISTGDLLRAHRARGTDLGEKAEGYMRKGELVPDDVMIAMVGSELPRNGAALFDGFPRTIAQARALDELLAQRERSVAAVYFEIERGTLEERLAQRGREDDDPQTLARRLEVFESQTMPLVDYYERSGRLARIDAGLPVDGVTQELLARLAVRAPSP